MHLFPCPFPLLYYPPEVRREEYWGLGVFLLQYFLLVKIRKLLHYIFIKMNYMFIKIELGSRNKKHPRGPHIQATIHPLAIKLTTTLQALVSI